MRLYPILTTVFSAMMLYYKRGEDDLEGLLIQSVEAE